MIKIGKIYHTFCNEQARLCADIDVDGRCQTLWYGVPKDQADYLTQDRADPFVLLFTPLAMLFGHNITSESQISARLHYQIEHCLIPTLHNVDEKFKLFTITAPLTDRPHKNIGGVTTAFSGGVDSMYTVMKHLSHCEIPLTHLTLFNVGVFEGKDNHEKFEMACKKSKDFAQEIGLPTVFLDSNQRDVMPKEKILTVNAYRNMAGALALQGLLSIFLYSSSYEASQYSLSKDMHAGDSYEHIAFFNFSTEGLSAYLSGMEATRYEKLAQLSDWTPSYNWLHPCFHKVLEKENCGYCKKCARDMLALYAMGKLDRYASVFPLDHFEERLPELLATVMLQSYYPNSAFAEALQLFLSAGKKIPDKTYAIIKAFCDGARVCDCSCESLTNRRTMRSLGLKILKEVEKC